MAISLAISPSAVARIVGIETIYRNLSGGSVPYVPQRVAVFGQGATASTYSTDKRTVFSADEVGSIYGYGSPLHLAVLQLLPINGDGVGIVPVTVYPLEDDGAAVTATGSITPVITGVTTTTTFRVVINNIRSVAFTVTSTDAVADVVDKIVAAVNAVLEMPVIATDDTPAAGIDAKWGGASGNDIYVEIDGPTDAGITFTIVQPTGGATNPDVTDALAQIGEVWETMLLNCLDIADTDTLDLFQTWGDGRWLAEYAIPSVVFTGNTEADVATAYAIPDARKTDKINSFLVSPGSHDLPCVVAARELARIVAVANSNPARDYGSQSATGLTPGADGDQWTSAEREAAVKAGLSTIQVRDGVVRLSDTVTFYHPTGETLPPYRFVVDIVKLQQLLYGLAVTFKTPEWDGAPLIPDDQPTSNPAAKKPRTAKAVVNGLIDSWALDAIISDPDFAKAATVVGISETNPKRLEIALTVKLSGNTNIIPITLNFGFYFGAAQVV